MNRFSIGVGLFFALVGCPGGGDPSGSTSSTAGAAGSGGSTAVSGAGGGLKCFAADPCGSCVAMICCADSMACSQDSACQADSLCLLGCAESVAMCVLTCNTDDNAAFAAYGACIADHCAAECEQT